MIRLLCLLLTLWLALPALARERVLMEKKSPYTTVRVTQDGPERKLQTRDAAAWVEQSRGSVKEPWRLLHGYLRLQLLALALAAHNDDLLVVGLGGGSLSNALAHALPAARVDSIELDPVVTEAARRYFGYRETNRRSTFVMDARKYLETSQRRYDVIFLDAFDGLEIPGTLRTRQFYQLVKDHLKPGGAVVTNLHQRSALYGSDRNTLAAVFANSYAFQATAQVSVICQDGPARDRSSILQLAQELNERLRLPYPVKKLAASLLSEGDEWKRASPILND